MTETYISVDIEADGPVPIFHSMISLGAAAFDVAGMIVATFSENLDPLPDAVRNPETTAWWDSQPAEVYAAARTNARPASDVMRQFDEWVRTLPGQPVFVANPASFDFTFVVIYLHLFTGTNPFEHKAFDMKSAAMVLAGLSFWDTTPEVVQAHWPAQQSHTHVALDDAIEHGQQFVAMLADAKARLLSGTDGD